MSPEISLKNFFDIEKIDDEFLHHLFYGIGPAWDALNRLKEVLRQHIRPNIPDELEPLTPLTRAVVILPKGYLLEGFTIELDTKGTVEIWIEGEHEKDASLISPGAVLATRDIEIGKGVFIEPGAFVKGPTIIRDKTVVRQGAYVRGDCYFGKGCVVGHTTEVKHSVFLDNAKAGHFAYIGDSILGRSVNLGAGTKLANLRLDGKNIKIRHGQGTVDTGQRKLGGILGDKVQVGCNAVTNPGTLLGASSIVAPNVSVMPGVYPQKSIIR